jgi:transposase
MALSIPYQMIWSTAVSSAYREADSHRHGDDPTGSDGEEVDWDGLLAQLAAQPLDEGWVTLEEASNAAGVSRSTLRSWYRSGQIPARMVVGGHGPQRLVPLEQVVDRALRSARARRQLEQARSVEAEVAELRRRLEAIERHLGIS